MAGLDAVPLFADMDQHVRERFASRCRHARCEANELVIDYDDASTDVYFLLSGRVRVLYRTPTGKESILAELEGGQFFGELAAIDGQPRSANITALQRAEMLVMPAEVFREMVKSDPEIGYRLLARLSRHVRDLNTRLAEYSFLQARHRLYSELLRLSRPRPGHGEERSISPPPLQHDLAARIGSRREVVSRELSALKRQGLIEPTRGALVIKAPGELNRRILGAMNE